MIWDMTLDTLFWLSTSACNIIHPDCLGQNQQVHQGSLGNTTAKSLWSCMAWMSTTAKHVGIILQSVVQLPWTHWRRSIIQLNINKQF